ncbi:MAG: hypothetical protein KDE58_01640 [Caldilineaceae bacterium]|nr:hypothetical protein [Caldilineaceae bacterium]
MKAIHYDAEGDVLSVTFAEARTQQQTGIELSDNIVLYYNPETNAPLQLILLSYQAMVQASRQQPILLEGLANPPLKLQKTIAKILTSAPISAFLQLVEEGDSKPPTSRLREIFTPATLQTVLAT